MGLGRQGGLGGLTACATNAGCDEQRRDLIRFRRPFCILSAEPCPVARDLPQSITVGSSIVRLDFEFQAFKNRIDEQELNRQVFSLIILRRFSPPESFNTSGSIVNSVSELLSNQLANFVSQVDENLEIDVDLSTFDDAAYNTFQLRLSYTFLNGRLRVTRDGTFYGSQNSSIAPNNTGNQVSAIAGDWTVDYLLTADGKLKIKCTTVRTSTLS